MANRIYTDSERFEAVRSVCAQGSSIREVARGMGVSAGTVQRWVSAALDGSSSATARRWTNSGEGIHMDHDDFVELAGRIAAVLERSVSSGSSAELESLEIITHALVDAGAADHAAVTEVTAIGEVRTLAPTGPEVSEADSLQQQLGEGVCIESSYDAHSTLSSGDLRRDRRWTRWGPLVADLGLSSVVSVRFGAGSQLTVGTFNMWFRDAHEVTPDDLVQAQIAAAHASIEIAYRRGEPDLWQAIDCRHRIGQAQGVLMQLYDLDTTTSYAVVRQYAEQFGVHPGRVADALVRTVEESATAASA